MHYFPLPMIPSAPFRKTHGHKRWFGAPRPNGRKHAGCDLLAPLGTPIIAVADGRIAEWNPHKKFYANTYSLVVEHPGFTARYCEIRGVAPDIHLHQTVAAGDVIAYVGKMVVDSMLHFEMYSGAYGRGHLSCKGNDYHRRADLIDPTDFLSRARVRPSSEIPPQELGLV